VAGNLSKPLRTVIHRFGESEYERRGDVRARCEVGRDVACRGVVKRANGQRCEGVNSRRYQAINVQVSRSSRKRNKD
jgi:hypothetical protein